jgi:hypothetical protein
MKEWAKYRNDICTLVPIVYVSKVTSTVSIKMEKDTGRDGLLYYKYIYTFSSLHYR